jgi:hypothetical protein
MIATELIQLIFELHQPDRAEERRAFYAAFEPYLIETDYDWQAAMNEPAEEGIIMSGVYLAWAQDTAHGLHFWDTTGKRYLRPPTFAWTGWNQR